MAIPQRSTYTAGAGDDFQYQQALKRAQPAAPPQPVQGAMAPVGPNAPEFQKQFQQPPQQPPVQQPQQAVVNPVSNQQNPNLQPPVQSGQPIPNASIQKPWERNVGEFDQNYVPKDLQQDPIFSSNLTQGQKDIATANYLKSKGYKVDTSQMAATPEDEYALMQKNNEEDKSKLDLQIDAAQKRSQQQTQGAIAATEATTGAVNREGVQSTGNIQAAKEAVNMYQESQATLNAQYKAQKDALARAQAQGDANAIKNLSNEVQSTQQKLIDAGNLATQQANAAQQVQNQTLQTLSSTGALANMTPDELQAYSKSMNNMPLPVLQAMQRQQQMSSVSAQQKEQLTAQTTTLNNAKSYVEQGNQISPQMAMQFAQQTGLSTDDFLQYNEQVQNIRADKSLSLQEQMQKVQSAGLDLNQKQQGIFNEAQQNTAFLANMYKNGASPDMIAAFKSAAHITDTQDPMYQADLGIKQAQAVIDTKHANGEAVTPQDISALADAKTKLNALGQITGGEGSAYIPNNSIDGITSTFENGKITITAPPGTKMQCGAGVNRFWGLPSGTGVSGNGGMPNEYTGKQALVNTNGIRSTDITDPSTQIVAGMAFVMPEGGAYASTGHTGIVVQNLGNGQFLTDEWNAAGNEEHSQQIRNVKQVYGFANPPPGSFNPQSSGGEGNGGLNDLAKSIANYDIDPKDLSTRLPKGATESERSKVLQMAKQINPDFSEGNFASKKAYIDSWSGNPSPGTPAFMNDTANTAIKHLKAAYDAFTEIKNGGAKDANGVVNYIKEHAGDPNIAAFLAIQEPLAGELGKASTGGVPNESEMENYRKILDVNKSPDAMMATIKAQMELLGGRVKTNVNRYQKTIGTMPKDSVLDPESQEALKKMGLKPEDYDPSIKTIQGNTGTQVTAGTLKDTIQKAIDSHMHTTSIIQQLQNNPATKDWVNNAMAHVTSPQDYQDIVNHFLQA